MKFSYLIAFAAMFVSTQAQAFDLEAFTNRVYPHCWPPQTAEAEVETCIGQAMVDICDLLHGSERAECEAAGATALAKYTVQAATARAEKAEAALTASRRAQSVMALPAAAPTLVVAPPPVVAPAQVLAPTPIVTAPPRTQSVAVVSNNPPTSIHLSGTPESQDAVFLAPPQRNSGSVRGLDRWGGAYVVYMSQIPARVMERSGTEWVETIGQRVDLNGDGELTLNELNVQIVPADNVAMYFAGNSWDDPMIIRWVNVQYDANTATWRPVRKATLTFDYTKGFVPLFNTDVHVSSFR